MSLTAEELRDFYDEAYRTGIHGETYGRWRALGAVTKADHVLALTRGLGIRIGSIADVGCGDGALLDELSTRGFGDVRIGYEISPPAVALAAGRPGVTEARLFDGRRVPVPDGTYDLAIASHVLEHTLSPGALVAELARIARVVVVEVPLEANLAARRASARLASREAGHIHRFSRRDVRALVAAADLEVRAELSDPLPLAVHLFARTSRAGKLLAWAKWGVRAGLARVPVAGERLITLHYALAATRST
jgi:SAM-dependent methyltransferase